MKVMESYIPTRTLFGRGVIERLGDVTLPGTKALICTGSSKSDRKAALVKKVVELLDKNGVETVVYDKIVPNPTRAGVMESALLAKQSGCDFVVGLGGGSSIDSAKATAVMMVNDGDLWDYASVGTGGRKPVEKAAPIVAVSTTSGTGTELDPYSVITNEDTSEKLDFAAYALFPTLSVIDPALMDTLPARLTVYQGFDALFHAAECYISNSVVGNELVDMYAEESVRTICKWLPIVAKDGSNMEGRDRMAYAADILSGYTQALINTTSHHIIGQCLGGLYPDMPHGFSLIVIARKYYETIARFVPEVLDRLGAMMGEAPVPDKPGMSFAAALGRLIKDTGMENISIDDFGVKDYSKIADIVVDQVGIDFDIYALQKSDIVSILENSK